ncbi:hypothetical protein B566_EDAN001929 [Ephemera danica]|nr:hypothetical protein B566_EDAN001929 [Ephemera danica]
MEGAFKSIIISGSNPEPPSTANNEKDSGFMLGAVHTYLKTKLSLPAKELRESFNKDVPTTINLAMIEYTPKQEQICMLAARNVVIRMCKGKNKCDECRKTVVCEVLSSRRGTELSEGDPDCWSFVEALQWLQPSLATSPPFRAPMHGALASSPCNESPSEDSNYSRYSDWLYRSLESHSLSAKLSWLLSDASHLENCYLPSAFLRRQRYAEAILICLRAVEQGQPSLLTDLDPRLYLSQWTSKHFVRSHRRCSSFPDNMRPGCLPPNKLLRKGRETRRATTISHLKTQLSISSQTMSTRGLFRQWNSEPNLIKDSVPSEVKTRSRGRSATTTAIQRRKMSASMQQKIKSLLSVSYVDVQKHSQENLKGSSNNEIVNTDKSDLKITESVDYSEEPNRDSIELAREACEDICAADVYESSDVLSSQNTADHISAGISQIVLDDATNVHTLPIEILMRRPNELSLSLNVSGNKAYSNSRRASDTALGSRPMTDVTNGGKQKEQLRCGNVSTESSATSNSQIAEYPQHLPQPDIRQHEHRKVSTDTGFLSPITSELTPPRVTPCYTPSSSLSLSPPYLPIAAFPGVQYQQRTLEANSFLASSGRFSDPAEELGRENAHFSVSEAMIAAIERAKCERIERGIKKTRGLFENRQAEDTLNSEEEDDPEIAQLQERIRVRRREKEQREKRRQQARARRVLRAKRPSQVLQSDGRTDTGTPNTTTATDVSDPPSSLSPSSLDSEPEEFSKDVPVDPSLSGGPSDNLARLRDAGLSMSLASLYSESELAARQPAVSRLEESGSSTKWSRSAEGVAWGLLRQFSGRALPRDSELQWLVSEQEAPQRLAVIPGKVLDKWDFNRCPVSNFSYRLLEQMQSDALFRVEDLNPSLFRKSRKLAKCKLARIQVSQLRDFVINCRFATHLHTLYRHEPPHLTTDPELYSLKDLIDVHNGELLTRLQDLITASTNHVANCELCTARGFVCELCHSRDVIFPWDVMKVVRCQHCGCCLHLACWKGSHTPATSPSTATPDDCPRCIRIKARHQNQTDVTAD